MSTENHVQKLREKHARIETILTTELKRPHPSETTLMHLKQQKLKIKDVLSHLADS